MNFADTVAHEAIRLSNLGGTYKWLYNQEKDKSDLQAQQKSDCQDQLKYYLEKNAALFKDLGQETRKKKIWRSLGSSGTIAGAVGGFLLGVFLD